MEQIEDHRLARRLGLVARDLQCAAAGRERLTSLVRAAAAVVPGTDVAGVSFARRSDLTSAAETEELAGALDELQARLGEGPCLAALRERQAVHIDDMSRETRWPGFAAGAIELGVASVLSFQLYVHEATLGALNLYARGARAFGGDSLVIGELFATHAAVAWAESRKQENLARGLQSRDVIGEAKGILMQRDGLSGEEAFSKLVVASQTTNVKLVEVARWLVAELQQRSGYDPG
jgi:GAF domain-containing protein